MIPHNIRIVVVFPAPSGPTRANISPFRTSSVNPLTAVMSPNFFETDRNSMAFFVVDTSVGEFMVVH
jgi:hypothetical protein